ERDSSPPLIVTSAVVSNVLVPARVTSPVKAICPTAVVTVVLWRRTGAAKVCRLGLLLLTPVRSLSSSEIQRKLPIPSGSAIVNEPAEGSKVTLVTASPTSVPERRLTVVLFVPANTRSGTSNRSRLGAMSPTQLSPLSIAPFESPSQV